MMKKKMYKAPQTGAESLTGWQLMNVVSPTVKHNEGDNLGLD